MSQFDDETRVVPIAEPTGTDDITFGGQVHPSWNIGANPNGGYLLALAAQAVRQRAAQHPDPLSISVHYLRPGLAGQPCRIRTRMPRSGRTLSTLGATLEQDGSARLELLAAMGNLGEPAGAAELTLPMPEIPPPEACRARSGVDQGVELPILQRLDVRLHPDEAQPGEAGRASISGWIRFVDGREPDTIACLLMADAFPPAVFGLLGLVGWVPTIELTVHVRRRPAPGWVLGRFTCRDSSGGRLIEDGALWDSTGQLVARSRQLALLRRG